MSAVYAVAKSLKNTATKKCVREIFLTFYRSKNSRFLGYYMRKLRSNVFEQRKKEYRENVLQPLEEMPSLQERLEQMNAPDPILDAKVDIGFTRKKSEVSIKDRLDWRRRVAEMKAKYLKEGEVWEIDLHEIQNHWYLDEGPDHIKNIADHYGIFSHLFDHGYFFPCVPLKISFDHDEETVNPVYMGNILEASMVTKQPNVSFKSKPDNLWTLVFTNLDGHLLDTSSEYLHWFVGNIKGDNLESGEVICDYLRPFPIRGTGYHRLVFVLYKQDKVIDYSSIKRAVPCTNLKDRTFKTFDFYKSHQDHLTPASLTFFQCTWDESLTDFFHNVLNMREPVFEYIEPTQYHKPQEQYPHLQPFNVYLDRYRDPKEIKKEVLLKRLKMVHPFQEEPPMPKYPCLHKPENYRFSWQRDDILRERLRIGKYRDLRPHSVYPQEDDRYKSTVKT